MARVISQASSASINPTRLITKKRWLESKRIVPVSAAPRDAARLSQMKTKVAVSAPASIDGARNPQAIGIPDLIKIPESQYKVGGLYSARRLRNHGVSQLPWWAICTEEAP